MSLISKIYSGSYSALSYVGSSIKSGMSKSYAVGCKAVEKIGKVFLAIKQGREALRQPNVTICTKISQGLQGVKLGQLLAVPLTSQPKAISFFDKFQSKQTSWLIRRILGKAKTTPLTQKQAQCIAPKIGSAITEKNVQNVTGALLSATQGMAKAVAIIGAAPDVAQMKSDLLTHFNEPGKSVIDFEQEKQRVRKQVHSNICTLLALKKEETPFFSLDYLAILGAYIAVKWFNMDLDALASAYEMAIGEIGDSSELINKFKEGGEFVVLKFLQGMTEDLLLQGDVNKKELDARWDDFIEDLSSTVPDLLDSSVPEPWKETAVAASGIVRDLGSDVLLTIRPSKILPTVVKELQAAAVRT